MTGYDIAVFVIILISLLIGFMRGFTREFFSLIAWIAASVLTVYLYPILAEYKPEWFKNIIASIAAAAVLFTLILVILGIINSFIVEGLFRSFRFGFADRALGTLFGLLRGVIIVSIMAYTVMMVYEGDKEPPAIADSRTYEYTQMGGLLVRDLLPAEFRPAPKPAAEPEKDPVTEPEPSTL